MTEFTVSENDRHEIRDGDELVASFSKTITGDAFYEAFCKMLRTNGHTLWDEQKAKYIGAVFGAYQLRELDI